MRTPRFTFVSDGNPLRRLLVISKFESSESRMWFAIRPPWLRVAVVTVGSKWADYPALLHSAFFLPNSKGRARSDLDSTVALRIELLASKREGGFEPPTYSVR